MGKLQQVIVVIIFLFAASVMSVGAQTYTWTDKNGVTQFTDTPPPPGAARKYNPPKKVQKSRPNVELFVTSWCPYCKKAKAFFRSKGIAFIAYDIEKNKKAAIRKRKLDQRQGVPFAIINGKYIHGYSPQAYEFALYNK